jgi:hypothetical protein
MRSFLGLTSIQNASTIVNTTVDAISCVSNCNLGATE